MATLLHPIVRTKILDGKLIDLNRRFPDPHHRQPRRLLSPTRRAHQGDWSQPPCPDVPAFAWCYGCSATSGAMMAGYYDRTGYLNMYAGPTNGGICPMDNSSWGLSPEGSVNAPSAPPTGNRRASHRGQADDYYYEYAQHRRSVRRERLDSPTTTVTARLIT